jgi:hypothetical protein
MPRSDSEESVASTRSDRRTTVSTKTIDNNKVAQLSRKMTILEKENKELKELVQSSKQNYELLYSSISNLNTAVNLLINQHHVSQQHVGMVSVYGGGDASSLSTDADTDTKTREGKPHPADSGVNIALDKKKGSPSEDAEMIFRRRSVV